MKTALLTDLHANREAVSAVLEHAKAQGVQAHAFLGDLVGYGADPGWVVDVVREHVAEHGSVVVMGNHDMAVAKASLNTMHPQAKQVVEWTRERLNAEQLAFLAALPMTQVQGDVLYVHANAYQPAGWDYVQGRSDAVRSMQATDRAYTFCGHMHEPRLFHLSGTGKAGEFVPSPGIEIPVPKHRQWLAIPGAAGQPRDGNPAACYAIFDAESATLTYHRVPYDHEAAGAKIRAANLPQRLAARLNDGE